MESLQKVLDYFQLLVRYIVSGFTFIIALALLNKNELTNYADSLFIVSPWILVATAMILGILTYAIHQALFDRLFYRICIWIYKWNNDIPTELETQIKETYLSKKKPDKIKNKHIRFALFTQTYLRRNAKDPIVLGIQKEMDTKFALLNFMYCTVYALLMATLVTITCNQGNTSITTFSTTQCTFSLISAIAIWCVAIIYDYNITLREMWTVKSYFQPIEPTKNVAPVEKKS